MPNTPQNSEQTANAVYDLLVIGGGPAGLAAAIYGARAKLKLLLLEKDVPGGQAAKIKKLNNYPGASPESSGAELMADWVRQAEGFGVEIKSATVSALELSGELKTVITTAGRKYRARAVIVCCGVTPSKLEIPGKQELLGHGVSYCVTCDAPFMRDKEAFLYGSGAHIAAEAEILCRFAKHLHLVIPYAPELVSNRQELEELTQKHQGQLDILWNRRIVELKGKEKLASIILADKDSGAISEQTADGIFFFIGLEPQTDLLRGQVQLNADGYVITDQEMRTTLQGVYAAGDIREKSLRQVVTAAADGAIAATTADADLQKQTKD